MTGADRMNKLLARAEAENATLKDEVARLRALLLEWQEWEAAASLDTEELNEENTDWLISLRLQRSEALRR